MQLSTTKLENVKEVKSIVKGTAIYSEKYFDSFKSSVEIKKGGFLDIFALSTDKTINEAINELSAKAHDLEANAVPLTIPLISFTFSNFVVDNCIKPPLILKLIYKYHFNKLLSIHCLTKKLFFLKLHFFFNFIKHFRVKRSLPMKNNASF